MKRPLFCQCAAQRRLLRWAQQTVEVRKWGRLRAQAVGKVALREYGGAAGPALRVKSRRSGGKFLRAGSFREHGVALSLMDSKSVGFDTAWVG